MEAADEECGYWRKRPAAARAASPLRLRGGGGRKRATIGDTSSYLSGIRSGYIHSLLKRTSVTLDSYSTYVPHVANMRISDYCTDTSTVHSILQGLRIL